MNLNLAFKSITLPAQQTVPVAVTGSLFFCKSADALFKLSFDGNAEIDMDQGWQVELGKGEFFRNLLFVNPTNGAITVTYFAGTEQLRYWAPVTIVKQIVTDAPTYAKGGDLVNLAAAGTIVTTGLDGASRRRQIVVTNLDANFNLQILDSNNKVFAVVLPQRAWALATSAALTIKNATANPIQCVVGETFYS